LAGTGSTLFFRQIVLQAAHIIFRQIVFGGSSNLEGTGFTLFSSRLFWKFGRNWLQIIFRRIVLKAAQIWEEQAPHYFLTDCFGGSLNLAGTGTTLFSNRLLWRQLKFGGNWLYTLFSDRLFWRQLKFGGNWLHIIFGGIVLEIWREVTPHYFPADCFGGSSDWAGTGSTLFFRQIVLDADQIWQELAPHYFLTDCF
jgi:hypothetical protein